MNRKILWILKKCLRYCWPYITINILITFLVTLLSLAINVLNKNVVNELTLNITSGTISIRFVLFVIAYIVFYFINASSGFFIMLGNNFYRLNIDQLFRKIFMYKSYHTPQERFFDHSFMEKYSFVNGRTHIISSYIGNLCKLLFSNIAAITGALALFIQYEPFLVVFLTLLTIMSFWLTTAVTKKQYELDKKQIKEQRFSDYYRGVLTGRGHAKELRIYKLKSFMYNKWIFFYEKILQEKLKLSVESTKIFNRYDIAQFAFRVMGIAILLLGIYRQRYDVGEFVMLFGLIEGTMSQIRGLTKSIAGGVLKDAKYLCDYYDFINPITDQEIKQLQKSAAPPFELKFGPFQSYQMKNISFTYPMGNKKAVDDVSLTIKKGEIISILGYNGSGKTTLSKIMNGSLAPQEGKILLNGIPIDDSNRKSIGFYFGNGPQEFSRFSLPIKEIIGLGCVEKMFDDDELHQVYEKTNLKDFLSKYKDGENTILGKEYDDNGVDLSGGEWQRLIVAAAHMGEPEILLLDEPTASIDPLLEEEFINNLRMNLQGKTAVLISHRIGFARIADRIVLLNDGKITEQGTHEELLKHNGYYAKLHNEQKKLYTEEESNETS